MMVKIVVRIAEYLYSNKISAPEFTSSYSACTSFFVFFLLQVHPLSRHAEIPATKANPKLVM